MYCIVLSVFFVMSANDVHSSGYTSASEASSKIEFTDLIDGGTFYFN
jgi:hypothetical protein